MFADPGRAVDEVTAFLGIRPWRPAAFQNFSREPVVASERSISRSAIVQLRRALQPQVVELERLLGRSMAWQMGAIA